MWEEIDEIRLEMKMRGPFRQNRGLTGLTGKPISQSYLFFSYHLLTNLNKVLFGGSIGIVPLQRKARLWWLIDLELVQNFDGCRSSNNHSVAPLDHEFFYCRTTHEGWKEGGGRVSILAIDRETHKGLHSKTTILIYLRRRAQ